jgi:hypothetical protein
MRRLQKWFFVFPMTEYSMRHIACCLARRLLYVERRRKGTCSRSYEEEGERMEERGGRRNEGGRRKEEAGKRNEERGRRKEEGGSNNNLVAGTRENSKIPGSPRTSRTFRSMSELKNF